ncbi:MAG: AsmA-like C-terminal region-containing protein, partial [Desulfuromonadales bacterium]|nr:AsmA-like C-terminal region-containing protein [Desulfuromonadales bacterium]
LLEGKRVRSEKMSARLGKSPVILQAKVADLQAPRLELDVKASAIRADELVFRSDRSFLREIDGRLIFDREGLQFAPVKTRLDGGTRATISGSVKNFASPKIDLEIIGDYANVEEIIGLWTNESPAAEKTRLAHRAEKPHGPLPPIRIKVEAREGDLYSMKFANARALIVPTSERLLIHPLDFNVGAGYCTTQVLVDYSGSHSVLRTSGHVEDVDAYEVVNELLDRKSIMRGSLRGDFYLQGELGEGRFLRTSYGNINATVRDGVMRHSPVLSTVFSLLNVSQLFSFKLPDVNSEGVPFTRLAAELAVDKGVMSSDLIVIDSEAMNMSYVGKYDMVKDDLDLLVVVKPLGTIDKVVTSLPIAGWILGGEEQALITAQFKVTGHGADPDIEAIPISAMSRGVLGIFQRTLSLPLKLIEDPAILWGGGGEKKK